MCDQVQENRVGQLCGSCKHGYALPVYSYSLACVTCSDYKYNWLKYLVVAFLPLTLFYIVVIMFKVSLNSGVMSGYILTCQIFTVPAIVQIVFTKFTHNINILVALHAIWNLDFFRSQYSFTFCLHPNLSTLQTISLEFSSHTYVSCFMIITLNQDLLLAISVVSQKL